MRNNIMAAGSRDRPYTLSTIVVPPVSAIENSPAVPEHTTVESLQTISSENKAHYKSENEAIYLILTGIGDEIFSTEFGKLTSHDGETMESYYTRFYKMMNEMIRNNLTVATMQVNVQFLQQLQPEWSRIAKNANPLALVATAQSNQDPYYQTPKSHKPYAPTSKASIPTRSHATTRNKGKEIAKPIIPPSESTYEEDSDPEQDQRDKNMQKNLALIAKYFKKIYKPTNNNLKTSSNSRNKNVDTTPRYRNDNQSAQFGNQRAITVAEARENVEVQKPKRVKDSTYHKEKMLLCKQAEQGVHLQAEQSDWLADMDDEIDEQELEAHYSFMAKIQEVVSPESNSNVEPLEQVQNDDEYNVFSNVNQHCEQFESTSNTCFVEKDDSDVTLDSLDMCENDIQTDQNAKEERAAHANLTTNLKLNVDENKKIQKQLKKANTSLAHELVQCKSILGETSKTLEESNNVWDSCLVAIQTKQTKFEKYKACNNRTVDDDKLETVKEKHDELFKQSLLTKSNYKGLVKEKIKTQNESLAFVHELKQEMHADLKYVESLEKEINDLEYDKAEFSNMYDTILQEYTSGLSQQELDLLFGPLCDEVFNEGTLSVNKSSSPTDNSKQQDTPSKMNIQYTTEPTIPTTANAEENNDNQAEDEFTNPFCTPLREVAESSSRNIASFQDDIKYDHVGQDTRLQGGNDDQDSRRKI
uniref:Integrase, catalytic region, zinc finger, CCHC-type, peptidase aspartic, catalytic n=1 Tax=Tanacetum cinerariifolium TaxID=118510 RepID=A0A699H255_TANCI|nr:hypothetical protein [Tanacetum cinerariifolium]